MGRPLDKEASEPEAPADDRPGRVEFDSRGNSVWRWARDVLDSTSLMLKRLDNKDLALEPTQKVRVAKPDKTPHAKHTAAATAARGSAEARPVKPARGRELDIEDTPPKSGRGGGGGFDPYNSR